LPRVCCGLMPTRRSSASTFDSPRSLKRKLRCERRRCSLGESPPKKRGVSPAVRAPSLSTGEGSEGAGGGSTWKWEFNKVLNV
jgi:hypothetical protein